MTLTEEQLEAIRAVSDLPRAIGCTRCHNYIQKNYSNQFAVLRSMIDSSGTVEPREGFDLEAARAGIAHYRIENHSNVDTESAIKELVDQANLAEDAVAEIERLRAENEEAQESLTAAYMLGSHEKAHEQAAHISELEVEIAELKADLEQSEICIQARLDVIDQQAARIKSLKKEIRRLKHESKVEQEFTNSYIKHLHEAEARIKELEDALVEERAGVITSHPLTRVIDEDRTEASTQLQAEGKIGNSEHVTDASKMIWQITEERVGLLEYCLETLLDAPDIEEIPGPGHSIEVLRAMLTEAGQ